MKRLQIELQNSAIIVICSDKDFLFEDREVHLIHAYIPGASVVNKKLSPKYKLIHKESDEHSVYVDSNTITYHTQWNGALPEEVFHLLAGMARNAYLESEYFSIHAACMGKKDLFLLLGHSGSGKTTLALELLKKHNMKLASGNTSTIKFTKNHNIEFVTGTKTITLDKSHLPSFKPRVEYGNRKAFFLNEEQYISYGCIKHIFIIQLTNGYQNCKLLSKESSVHNLYPFFLNVVNSDVILLENKVYPGVNSITHKQHLVKSLLHSLSKIEIYKISGDISYLAKQIEEITR